MPHLASSQASHTSQAAGKQAVPCVLAVRPRHALLEAQRVLVPVGDVRDGEAALRVVPVDVCGQQGHAGHGAITPACRGGTRARNEALVIPSALRVRYGRFVGCFGSSKCFPNRTPGAQNTFQTLNMILMLKAFCLPSLPPTFSCAPVT